MDIDSLVLDITGAPSGATSGLPFYIQIIGTQGSNDSKIIFDTNNYIYTDNGVGSTSGITVTVNTTYKMIYYPTSGNPFGTNYPSYIMVPETYNVMPLNQNIDCFILHTAPTYTSTAYLYVPEMIDGQNNYY